MTEEWCNLIFNSPWSVLIKTNVKAILVISGDFSGSKIKIPITATESSKCIMFVSDIDIFFHGLIAKPESSSISPETK